jgi:hypothetical protein
VPSLARLVVTLLFGQQLRRKGSVHGISNSNS